MKLKDISKMVTGELSAEYGELTTIPTHIIKRPKAMITDALSLPAPAKKNTAMPVYPSPMPYPEPVMLPNPLLAPAQPLPQASLPQALPTQSAAPADDIMSLLNLG